MERLSALGYSEADMAMYLMCRGHFKGGTRSEQDKLSHPGGVLMSGRWNKWDCFLMRKRKRSGDTVLYKVRYSGSSRRNGKYCIILILTKKYFNG
ncbi:MAG: hypothetical protein ACLU4N_18055 [Butyricimonas faecihominis]